MLKSGNNITITRRNLVIITTILFFLELTNKSIDNFEIFSLKFNLTKAPIFLNTFNELFTILSVYLFVRYSSNLYQYLYEFNSNINIDTTLIFYYIGNKYFDTSINSIINKLRIDESTTKKIKFYIVKKIRNIRIRVALKLIFIFFIELLNLLSFLLVIIVSTLIVLILLVFYLLEYFMIDKESNAYLIPIIYYLGVMLLVCLGSNIDSLLKIFIIIPIIAVLISLFLKMKKVIKGKYKNKFAEKYNKFKEYKLNKRR